MGKKQLAKRENDEAAPHDVQTEKKPRAATTADIIHMNFSLQVAKRILHVDPAAVPYQNSMCSPSLISAALSTLAAGSEGSTRQQLLRIMECDSVEEVNDVVSRLAQVLGGSVDGPMSFANALWVDHRWRIKDNFQKVLSDVHQTHVQNLDFQIEVDRLVEDANLWAEKHTKGCIKKIISRESIKEDTMMILCNALYFKGFWKETFCTGFTQEDDFYLLNGDKVQASFMKKMYREFEYGTLEGCKVLKMPYNNRRDSRSFSMWIFLPNEKDGLPSLMESINLDANSMIDLKYQQIDEFSIPKFHLECDIMLSETMKHLGLTLPFDEQKCDLTGMVGDTLLNDRPYVDEICQKCYVDANEQGTTAGAITWITMRGGGKWPPPSLINFVADHPFMFVIREDRSGSILFVGTVLDPTSC